MRTTSPASGMSLVELLVAMALGALLMGLLTSVLSSVRDGWQRTEAAVAASAEESAGLRFLLTSLAVALAVDPRDSATRFIGLPDGVEFYGSPPDVDASLGPMRFRYFVQAQDNGKKSLMVEMQAAPGAPNGVRAGGRRVSRLLNGLQSVAFTYVARQGDILQEAAIWDRTEGLPNLVRIDISFADRKAKPLHLAVAPRRNISGLCQFDLVGLNCRN